MAIIMLLHWIILENNSTYIFSCFSSISSVLHHQERLLLSIKRKKVLHIEANKTFVTSWELLDNKFCGMFFKLASPQCCKLLETFKKYILVGFWVYVSPRVKMKMPLSISRTYAISHNLTKLREIRFRESDVKWCWILLRLKRLFVLASIYFILFGPAITCETINSTQYWCHRSKEDMLSRLRQLWFSWLKFGLALVDYARFK